MNKIINMKNIISVRIVLLNFLLIVLNFFLSFGNFTGNLNDNNQPNVIIVITDDQGRGDLGCYGNEVIRTPNLDKFYDNAIRFNNFHVSTTCAPTRSSLMTGRHTNRVNCFHTISGRSLLFEDETIMAEVFAENGYATGMFGKWHLGDNYPFRPEDRGFQEVVRHGGGGITQGPDYWGNDYFDDTYWFCEKGSAKTVTKKFNGYCTDVFFSEALRFIEENKEDPFFCYISTNAPHGPLNVPEEYLSLYQDENRILDNQKRFYGMITNIDDNFEKLQNKLENLGLSENTLLVFMTDNGTAAGRQRIINGEKYGYTGGLRGAKGSQYEGGHRVPFILQWPGGGLTGGRDIDELVAHYDVLPTFVDLLGLKFNPGKKLDGISLVPLLKKKSENNWANRILYIDTQRLTNLVKGRNYAVMDNNWRLIDGKELYNVNIVADPMETGQTNNVIDQYPEVAERLAVGYEKWWNSFNASELNSRYAYIKVGTPYENPTRISAHDMLTGRLGMAWHQHGAVLAVQAYGRWKIEFAESGNYKISLRRFSRESGLGFNDEFPAKEDKIETQNEMPASNNLGFKEAYLYVADFEKSAEIKNNDEEINFTMRLPKGKFDLEARLFDKEGKAYPVYYLYIEKL